MVSFRNFIKRKEIAMRTPETFPNLRDSILQILTNVVKTIAKRRDTATGECSGVPTQEEIPAEAREEMKQMADACEIGVECLMGRDMGVNPKEVLDPIHRLDAWLRDTAMKGVAHWFSILVESFIGPCHVGPRFEHKEVVYVFHSYRERPVYLVTGPVTVKAAYYRREGGGEGLYPIDLILGLDKSGETREASFLMAHFSTENDYPESEALIERATGLRIDQNRLHRRIQSLGEGSRALHEAFGETEESPVPADSLVIETDGLMLQMRYDPDDQDREKGSEGWHEGHAGLVAVPGPAEPREPAYHRRDASPDREKKTKADNHPDVRLEEATYVATYEGRKVHLQKLKAEAVRRGWTPETKTAILGDGSPWVHGDTRKLFPDAIHILDWHHAMNHLAKARDLAFHLGCAEGAAWYSRQETKLWDGDPDPVIRSILYLARTSHKAAAKKLRTEAAFFRKRKKIIDYPAFRKAGWPIGSGAVESACRHVVQERCKCSGMRWSPEGLRNVLAVRTAILNNRFDELWANHVGWNRFEAAA